MHDDVNNFEDYTYSEEMEDESSNESQTQSLLQSAIDEVYNNDKVSLKKVANKEL